MKPLTQEQARKELQRRVDAAGSLRAFADEAGVSFATVGRCVRGEQPVRGALAHALGMSYGTSMTYMVTSK